MYGGAEKDLLPAKLFSAHMGLRWYTTLSKQVAACL